MPALIMVAPNGARRSKADHPALPVTIGEIVETAAGCFAAGARAIHAHVRDGDGQHVLDAGLYRELVAELAARVPAMAVQVTTEAVGRYSPAQQREVLRAVAPAHVSIALREMLADGDTAAARGCYHWARDADIDVQHILYEPAEIGRVAALIGEGVVPGGDLSLLFVLGRYSAGQESDPTDLDPFLAALAQTGLPARFMVCAFGRAETRCLVKAAMVGGDVRVGFENSLWNDDGSLASDNAQRVREIVARLAG